MDISLDVHAIVPISHSPEKAVLRTAPPYDTQNGRMVDIEVIMTEEIPRGSITHRRWHTFPASALGLITGVDENTGELTINEAGAAPLFAEWNIAIGPAPVQP